jgi:putative tricarboxylic transport membrane protein
MARFDRVFSFLWIALGIYQCIESVRLGLGSMMEPGTGFMPFVLGLVMIALASALFFESSVEIRKKRPARISVWGDVYWKRVVYITILMAAFAVLLPKLGYLIDTFLIMILLLKSGEAIKWPTAIFVGAVTAGFSYVLFGIWLSVSFPKGILSF